MKDVVISGRKIGIKEPPYVIGEISANHGGDLDRALRIIKLAAEAGADAVKLQLYTADSLTIDNQRDEFRIGGASIWRGERLYQLYQRAATPMDWFPKLFAAGRECGVTVFASVFDTAGIDILEELNAPAYKVASFEAVDLELIAACARTGKPCIISTGLCTLAEIEQAVAAFREAGGADLILLRCNSAYPANPAEANLASIPDMIRRFDVPVGYSDHTLDAFQAVAAVALGACVIEKHVIDSRDPPTADSTFSSLPEDFRALVDGCRAAHAARGQVEYGPTAKEQDSLVFRRSLFACRDIKAGTPLSRENVRSIRPGNGLAPRHLPAVLGRRAKRDIAAGEPLAWGLME